MENGWKKFLLKSGLPFEYEVKECFAKSDCTVWDEYYYLKEDENNVEKEFSYDLDANTWRDGCSIDFMVECKYKTEPTKWFFTPDPYAYQQEVNRNSFLHPMDHFTKQKFLFNNPPFDKVVEEPLGPFCLKGIEILKNDGVEVNITRAISQLSYAFVDKIISAMDSQLNIESFFETVFLHVPIIITNAELHLLKTNVTTKEIEDSKSIEEISTKHNFLFYNNKPGGHLHDYNRSKLVGFFASQDQEKIKTRINSFTTDLNHLVEVISTNYCPSVICIMHHDELHQNYKTLFDYIDFLTFHTESLQQRIKQVKADADQKFREFGEI
ncbi:hypothetical protein [Chryseolinea soli]|uniref:Uncharacterized protein n=1 Tax=Chryseolinea soli TaxID=2321403 RepID=A0A385SHY3_9BACT|nr:hypothetical protein [Chryseolinea soli]AYB30819.1 hypothetical protein D4L85_09625 [Chryseolinea soli]